jgi:hypothetical protein
MARELMRLARFISVGWHEGAAETYGHPQPLRFRPDHYRRPATHNAA